VEDEVFFVVEGRFLIDLEPQADGVTAGKVITLAPGEGFMVPQGVMHRTRAPERCVVLMIEPATINQPGAANKHPREVS
jgi:mannose-6-phosphate isomerase-like protein (cupin superfamily)